MPPSSDRPSAPLGTPDLELLRKFEPVVYYTKGEQFYPMDVESYVRSCSLWRHHPESHEELLVKQGELTLEKLAEVRPAEFGAVRYLRFVENLNLAEAAQVLANQLALRRELGNYFHPGIGRLARGGFLPRLVDGLFSLSFLLRGKVSAATAAAAEIDYNAILNENKRYTYYGRVIRQSGWTVLQYWFFFCFNSWRSGFHGVNDHESDWEMVNVYLYEQDGQLIPEWVAYASHDFKGDDLRRRWDDREELKVEDGHPVVYAGAGSHASYFRYGEYQAEVDPPLPGWVSGLIRAWNRFWTETLGQPPLSVLRIPFVDFARGDGLRIGPRGPESNRYAGESNTQLVRLDKLIPQKVERSRPKKAEIALWSPVLVDETAPWLSQYHGLWGLYARDPVSGENAPAGPMYNRDGSPRSAWYDPLGFAGLDKVPPPPQALKLLAEDCRKISNRQRELEELIPKKAGELQALGVKQKGMEGYPHLARQYAALGKEIGLLSAEARALRREHSENDSLLQGLTRRLRLMESGTQDSPRGHISRLAVPDDPTQVLRFDRATETWAAVSLSLLLFAVAALIFFAPQYIWAGLIVILLLFVVTESLLRGAFIQTTGRVTLLLAMVATVILFFHFWKWVILIALVSIGIFLMYQRLRELTG